MSQLRPEDQLVICVARPSLNGKRVQQLHDLLRTDLDWERVLASAEQHSVVQLLYAYLNQSRVPEWFKTELELTNHKNTRKSFFLAGELVKLLSRLNANNIEAIPFKGPVLAISAYGNAGLREFGDLDIMIRKKDFAKLKEVMIKSDFKPVPSLTSSQEAAAERFDCARNFQNDQEVIIDVHWELIEPHFGAKINQAGLWDRLEPITIGGKQTKTFSSEDLLLVLCLHGFTHHWERLGWICDVATLVERKQNLNWEFVLAEATRLGVRRIVSLGLFLAQELIDCPVPPQVREELFDDPVMKKTAEQIESTLFDQTNAFPGLSGELSMHWRMRERKRDKLKAVFHLIATPRRFDWMCFSFPASLSFLYYPLRPVRLAGKYTTKLIKAD